MALIDSWKNKNVFEKQLELNIKQLSNNYPQHWMDFIKFIIQEKPTSILDIGCGCGTYYELCNREFNNIKYTGIDYSSDAIELAKNKWNYEEFYVKDINELSSDYINNFDMIHIGALLDVLPNGDDVLENMLKLSPKKLLIGRMEITDKPSYYETYDAYDEITTYRYFHNKNNLIYLCEKYGYIINNIDNNYLFKEKNK
jgi:ubiquinone/menaquinone biosynthesis C-methylase UbiE